jgi:iron complex transport system ATP-binding protein
MNAIEVEHVSVSLHGVPIVTDVSFSVPEGSWLCLIGPNGAGKTTVMRAIAGLTRFEGDIRVNGHAVRGMSRRTSALHTAVVPQKAQIPQGTNVLDYVLMGRTPHITYLGSEAQHDVSIARDLLDQMDLVRFAGREVASLSGGELQRVILARALAQQAPVLLLDEPTSSLDVGHQQSVLELADELRSRHELTLLAAMHDLTVAAQFADHLLLLDKGSVAASGPPAQVLTEELIGAHYGAQVRVIDDGLNGLVVVPLREKPSHQGRR